MRPVARCAREAGLWCHMAKPLVLGGSERIMFSATRPLEACEQVASHFTPRHKFSGEKSQLFAHTKCLDLDRDKSFKMAAAAAAQRGLNENKALW